MLTIDGITISERPLSPDDIDAHVEPGTIGAIANAIALVNVYDREAVNGIIREARGLGVVKLALHWINQLRAEDRYQWQNMGPI